MGPRSEDRGYRVRRITPIACPGMASMGPRSEDRGYRGRWQSPALGDCCFNGSTVRGPWLSPSAPVFRKRKRRLQWVHGPRTVVIGSRVRKPLLDRLELQWVHGPRTVVIAANPF